MPGVVTIEVTLANGGRQDFSQLATLAAWAESTAPDIRTISYTHHHGDPDRVVTDTYAQATINDTSGTLLITALEECGDPFYSLLVALDRAQELQGCPASIEVVVMTGTITHQFSSASAAVYWAGAHRQTVSGIRARLALKPDHRTDYPGEGASVVVEGTYLHVATLSGYRDPIGAFRTCLAWINEDHSTI